MPHPPVAEFDNVVKEYPVGLLRRKTIRAVAGVSLRIEPGEVLALLGPNRAGKSTLVKLLLSLGRPTSGRVLRFGEPARVRRTLARVGYLHENQAFPRYLSAAAVLEYYGALSHVAFDVLRRRVPELLEQVGLADRGREPIGRFSKGMIQRLGLAQALVNDPELLVLDEPNEGLDLTGRQLVAERVRELKQRGRAVLLVSHVLSEVEPLCDRLAVLRDARLIHVGPLDSLIRDRHTGQLRPLEQALRRLYEMPIA